MTTRVRDHRAEWNRRKATVYCATVDERQRLIADMGGKCKLCGARVDLQFDHHPKPRAWSVTRKNRRQRVRLYRRDWEAGLLRLACGSCNGSTGARYGNRKRMGRRK